MWNVTTDTGYSASTRGGSRDGQLWSDDARASTLNVLLFTGRAVEDPTECQNRLFEDKQE